MEMLAALSCVDYVISFNESTPIHLLKLIKPNLYVKGGDYDIEKLEETKWVRSWGGNAKTLPFIDGKSTTQLVNQIRSSLHK
jgi:rfaE bifunctional protein nucleotidyltransferase chain/domain